MGQSRGDTGAVTPATDDDEALGWSEDADLTHIGARLSATEPTGTTARTGSAAEPVGGSLLLVVFGILAGVYLLYTVGWVLSAQRSVPAPLAPFDTVMAGLRLGLAMAAAPAWFAATLWSTRDRKPLFRLLWLVLGGILLVPWPFVLGA